MIRIGLMGAPCTGKTTLAKALSIELQYRYSRVAEYIDEYARQFVANFGMPTVYDQYFFFEQQLKKENQISPKAEYLITDSPCYLSYIYGSKVMDARKEKDRHYFCCLVERIVEHLNRYDLMFYLPVDDNLPREDGMRIHTTREELEDIDGRIRGFFTIYNTPYHEIRGSLDERMERMIAIIAPERGVERMSAAGEA